MISRTAEAIRIEVTCRECGWRFFRWRFPQIEWLEMRRCATCAAAAWQRECAEREGRVLH